MATPDPRPGSRLAPLPWWRLLLLALVGTVLGTSLTLLDLDRTRTTNGGLIHTGPEGPAADLLAADFPDEPQFTYGEHDGPMFYAVARHPWDLDRAAASLDRPRYRLQHPVFPWLAWVLRPGSSGDDLLAALFAVGVLSLLGGGLAVGALSRTLGGPAWVALVFPILPGATVSLRITVADALAVALLAAALALSLRGHPVAAALVAAAAVLTKEPTVLTFAAVGLWRRDRAGAALVGVPVAVAGVWALFLRWRVDSPGGEVIEFGVPFRGLLGAVDNWLDGNDPYALVAVAAALGLAVAALVRRDHRHPLWFAVAANLTFVVLLNVTVIGLERNATRMTLPLLVVALVAVLSPSGRRSLPAGLDGRRGRAGVEPAGAG